MHYVLCPSETGELELLTHSKHAVMVSPHMVPAAHEQQGWGMLDVLGAPWRMGTEVGVRGLIHRAGGWFVSCFWGFLLLLVNCTEMCSFHKDPLSRISLIH